MRFAYVQSGFVVEAWSKDPFELFQPGYAALFVACPDEVQTGWTFDGTTWAEPVPPAPQVPQSVTMRQARLALLGAGMLTQVNAAITQADQAAQIEWEYAQTVERNSALVQTLAAGLGLTDADLDALFVAAATL
ncbi:MAG: hypothetical protein RJA34_1745 [Pseudomonadota bacterium]|jgi:hypothetical protein